MNNYQVISKTPSTSTTLPFTIADFKIYAKILSTDTTENTLIQSYIYSATLLAENYLNIAISPQTWTYSMDTQPNILYLPGGYLSAINSIKTFSTTYVNGVIETSSKYTVITGLDGFYYLKPGSAWNTTDYLYGKIFEIVFTCGFPTIPESILLAIKIIAQNLFENRETDFKIPEIALNLLHPWKIYNSII